MGNLFFHDHEASHQVSVEIAKMIQMCGLKNTSGSQKHRDRAVRNEM